MRLGTVAVDDRQHAVALLDEQQVLLLGDAAVRRQMDDDLTQHVRSVLSIVDGGNAALDLTAQLLAAPPDESIRALDDVRILAPLPDPRQIRDTASFFDHFRNVRARREGIDPDEYELPEVFVNQTVYYLANRMTIAGPGDDIAWPPYSTVRDYELELACVVGRSGRDIDPANAREHIFGFTLFNDLTARDTQRMEMASGIGFSKAKDFDGSNIFGPFITTIDEFPDPYDIEMTARINGVEVSRGNTSMMNHRWEAIFSSISRSTTLAAGEIVCSGTVPTGCGAEHGRMLEIGDTVQLEADRIGVLRNRIVA
jgi:2-keto-4-pentenoate hydratase/2-oxohepta-3-ene-1,7-dioic acid hydratase in catechol pathway